ncbi:hypothetical protein [Pontibacter sp. G13]|uniref:hypothetical protein n=1 Tax=Pontibacter sp. G13 TaxID=3074898 RepID=UPI00288A1075|nr:hypothetical protein [Pontibacter sp. G13]WNJ20633.1 hypothetical protein RJD25_09125 [Pontibacter sp. G13]
MKIKNLLSFLLVAMMTFAVSNTYAQLSSPERQNPKKVRKAWNKEEKSLLKEVRSKAVKEARKEAKKYRKADYVIFPGSLPMDKQLEKIWVKQLQENPDGSPVYIFADGNGVGKTQSAAELQAMEVAKLQMAGQISNEVNAIIESKIANEQIDRETGESLTKVVLGSKNYIVQHLGYVRPGFKVMRNVGRKDIEVNLKLYYNSEEAYAAAERAMEAQARAQLEDEADNLIDEINRLFDR